MLRKSQRLCESIGVRAKVVRHLKGNLIRTTRTLHSARNAPARLNPERSTVVSGRRKGKVKHTSAYADILPEARQGPVKTPLFNIN